MAKDQSIRFIVEYEDGSTALMMIDRYSLRSGDHVVRIIAREQQQAGTLPAGKIKSVRRDPQSRSAHPRTPRA